MPFLGVAFGLACLVTLGCGAGFDSTAFGAGATLLGGVCLIRIGVSSTLPFGCS